MDIQFINVYEITSNFSLQEVIHVLQGASDEFVHESSLSMYCGGQ